MRKLPIAAALYRTRFLLILGVCFLCLVLSSFNLPLWPGHEKSVEQLLSDGQSALEKQDYTSAVRSFERAITISPTLTSGWSMLADAACRSGQTDRSEQALEQLKLLDTNIAAKQSVQLARVWMNRNQIGPAIRALRISVEARPDLPDPYRLLAQISGVTGHTREVASCLVGLIKTNSFTRNDLIVLSSLNPGLDDPARLKLVLASDPTNKSPLLAEANHELNLNHFDRAEELLLDITEHHPDDIEAQGTLAELYAKFSSEKFLRWHQTIDSLNQSKIKNDARIWAARGMWLSEAGKAEAAVRCLYESLKREPEQLTATVLLGRLLNTLNESKLGSAYSERGRRLQQIVDSSARMKEPRANEFFSSMIEDLEATGRLWEAWGWCVLLGRSGTKIDPAITACKDRIQHQLSFDLPRSRPGSLPGEDFDWSRFPLPDWTEFESFNGKKDSQESVHQSGIRFKDRAEELGIDFRFINSYSTAEGRRIFETMGAGVAVIDFDNDGWPDFYFPQGNTSPTSTSGGPSDRIYRNVSGEKFFDVTSYAGIREIAYSQGVAAGDFDNDGFADIYVANFGRNTLYRNHGDGTFSDVTVEAGLTQAAWTVSCAIADLNGDGFPELFDVNYVQGNDLLTGYCTDSKGRRTVCRPTVYEPAMDTVCLNLGDGRFLEKQEECGLDLPRGMGLGLVIADFNDDNRLDVFVANDMAANYLLINDPIGDGHPLHFRDEGILRNVAFDHNGLAQACMGVACADINRDAQLDLFVTNFAQESNTLYLSQQDGFYQDRTQAVGLRQPSFDPLGFGTQFIDADNNGWQDLVVANGHIDEFVDQPFRMKPQFFRGTSDGRFTEEFASSLGQLFDHQRLGRALALVDWNRDGKRDFIATDLTDSVMFAENQSDSGNRSMAIRCIGTRSNRDAIGAKVWITVSEGDVRFAQITAGDGYQCSNERILRIGIGLSDHVDKVEIHWPSGEVSRRAQVPCGQEWLVLEGITEWLSLH